MEFETKNPKKHSKSEYYYNITIPTASVATHNFSTFQCLKLSAVICFQMGDHYSYFDDFATITISTK